MQRPTGIVGGSRGLVFILVLVAGACKTRSVQSVDGQTDQILADTNTVDVLADTNTVDDATKSQNCTAEQMPRTPPLSCDSLGSSCGYFLDVGPSGAPESCVACCQSMEGGPPTWQPCGCQPVSYFPESHD